MKTAAALIIISAYTGCAILGLAWAIWSEDQKIKHVLFGSEKII